MKRWLYFFCVLSVCFAAMPLLGQSIPEISYDSTPNLLKMPDDIYLGEVLGVATNSKGHIYVYTRTGSVNPTTGTNRVFVRSASRLFNSIRPENTSAKSGRDFTGLFRRTPCASIPRTISGWWTKAPT